MENKMTLSGNEADDLMSELGRIIFFIVGNRDKRRGEQGTCSDNLMHIHTNPFRQDRLQYALVITSAGLTPNPLDRSSPVTPIYDQMDRY